MTDLIPKHGGYRKLKSFQVSQLIYDVTVRFCEKYIERTSRTRDQMTQAARSGVQNIAEGSQVSATSKKMELKLTQVARASLEELKLDYEDFLRQRKLTIWAKENQLRQELINHRCKTSAEVAAWIVKIKPRYEQSIHSEVNATKSTQSTLSTQSIKGSKMPRGVKDAINNYPFMYPSLVLVKVFSQFVRSSLVLIDKYKKQNDNLVTLRDTLLPKLLSGEIDLSTLTPQLQEHSA